MLQSHVFGGFQALERGQKSVKEIGQRECWFIGGLQKAYSCVIVFIVQ